MKTIAIIPARYASTRFPGKPLANILDKPMIERTYLQTLKSNANEVIVATDDQRIFDCVLNFNGKAQMTSEDHINGTSRCFEVASLLNLKEDDVVINVQGDEPTINPEQINLLINYFQNKETTEPEIATLVKAIESVEELNNINIPKVVFNSKHEALYFSRNVIPASKSQQDIHINETSGYYKHIGIYAYTIEALREIASLPKGKLEKIESLEQLRWLEYGFSIKTIKTKHENIAIDTPEDLDRLIAELE